MEKYAGFNIGTDYDLFEFTYGEGVFGPKAEKRKLDHIRKCLKNPNCEGPKEVYSIVMDVGKEKDREKLLKRNLLYGAVIYTKGKLGDELVKSQGHTHAISKSCKSSTAEVYEIWSGRAAIYMQESTMDDPKRCFAVYANPGDVVVVPPNWAHCTVNINPEEMLVFGAWCVRDYGFCYEEIRKHNGLAWFPTVKEDGEIKWIHNDKYEKSDIVIKNPRNYKEFEIEKGTPIYTQFEKNPDKFLFVSNPNLVKEKWNNFIP